jgi:hypothetical protein
MTRQVHPGSHPDPDSLSAFLEGVLPEHERLECLAHFAECPDCREAVFLAQQPLPAVPKPNPVPVWRRWLAPIPVLTGAVAACVLAVLVFLYLFQRPAPQPQHAIARAIPPPRVPVAQAPSSPQTSRVASSTQRRAPRLVVRHHPSATVAPQTAFESRLQPSTEAYTSLAGGALKVAIKHDQGPINGLSEVTGLVTDSSGAVVPGATVTLRQLAGTASGSAQADARGHFEIAALPAGRYDLQVASPGFQQASGQIELQAQDLAEIASVLSVGAATEEVAVVAESGAVAPTAAGHTAAAPITIAPGVGSLNGTVTDSSGAVVPEARVVLKNEDEKTLLESVSDGKGLFNFPAVHPGSYTLTVSGSGFTTWEERGIQFDQEARLTVPNIVLQVGGAKSEVAVVAANDVVVPTDAGQASTTLNQQMISQISLAGRDAAELIKIMPGVGAVTGTVTDSSSAVVPNARVVLKDGGRQTIREAVSDTNGHFGFDSFNPGLYTLSVSAVGFNTWEQRIQFSQGSPLTIPNIVLQVGGATSEVAAIRAKVPTYSGQESVQPGQTTSSYSMASDSAGRINIMAGLPFAALPTVRIDKRVLTANSAGALLFSGDAGKTWEAVKPLWQGKVARLVIVTQQQPAPSRPVFQLTTDSGTVWLSPDGTHWEPAAVQH